MEILNLKNQQLILLSEKAIFWKEKKLLIIADIHLGKSSYLRSMGIATPFNIIDNELIRVTDLINKFSPKQVVFLGDLFHGKYNIECDIYNEWRKKHKSIKFSLIRGNHDKLNKLTYLELGLELIENELNLEPFIFTHEPMEYIFPTKIDSLNKILSLKKNNITSTKNLNNDKFYISGHLHPSAKLYGSAKQTISLPCFYFNTHQAILPSFGAFTGKANIKINKNDLIYVVVDNNVIKVEN